MTIIAAVMISYDMIKSKIQVSVNLIVNCHLSIVICQLSIKKAKRIYRDPHRPKESERAISNARL